MKKIVYLLFAVILFSSCSGNKTIELNVMSFNIRYDNPDDSLNNWQYRKDVAAQIIKDQKIDLLGTQEVLFNQLNDLKERLPEYNSIGVGREDGKEKGEYSAIFYKKDRFTEIKSGYFWLSETPEVAGSRGWDGACERIATWAILKDKEKGKELFFINTHLDHVGKVARREGTALLLQRVVGLSEGLPIILTGDFNSRPGSEVVNYITNTGNPIHLADSRLIATEAVGEEGTFHAFGRYPRQNEGRIDYIFVNDRVKVNSYESLPEKLNNIFLSDHVPVVAHVEVN